MGYQYKKMSQAQVEEFLLAPRFAIVGTNRRNGAPQLTPVWYLYENGEIYVSIDVDSAKYRNLRRDPRISLCIAGNHPDARAVMIYGSAELIPGDDTGFVDIYWRLNRRYFDSDEEARSYLESDEPAGASAFVRVIPDKVIAQDFN